MAARRSGPERENSRERNTRRGTVPQAYIMGCGGAPSVSRAAGLLQHIPATHANSRTDCGADGYPSAFADYSSLHADPTAARPFFRAYRNRFRHHSDNHLGRPVQQVFRGGAVLHSL